MVYLLRVGGSGKLKIKLNSAQLELELGLSLAKIPLMPMWVFASGSVHTRLFVRPPISMSGNFPAHMSAESPSKISPEPPEVVSKVSKP